MPEQITIDLTDADGGVRAVARRLDDLAGAEHVVFVDAQWCRGPAGGVDLFAAYSRHAGRSIRVREAICCLPAVGPVGLYLVPLELAGPFVAFLDALMVAIPDGRVVVPVHARADGGSPLAGCHLIASQAFAADGPEVAAVRDRLDAAAGKGAGHVG